MTTAIHKPIVLSSSIRILRRFSSKILFPTALSNTRAISLSSEKLSNSKLEKKSLKSGILGGDALFLAILNSRKSVSSSSSKISPFCGYYMLLSMLLSDLTWNVVIDCCLPSDFSVKTIVIMLCFLSFATNYN